MAWFNRNMGYSADCAYSVVSDGSDGHYYCTEYSFAHELSHNMGNAHDRDHADSPRSFPYSYGYDVAGDSAFGNIMSYDGHELGFCKSGYK